MLEKIKNKILNNKAETIGVLGILLVIIGTIVPTIYIANMPMNYISGDGKFLVIAMIIVGILMYFKKAIVSLIPTGLSCALLVRYLWMTTPTKAAELNLIKIATYGPGIYLMIIGLCLCLFYGAAGRQVIKEKEKLPFNKKYFFISLILPLIGIYFFVKYDKKDKEKSKNSLRGATLGFIIFFAFILIWSLAA